MLSRWLYVCVIAYQSKLRQNNMISSSLNSCVQHTTHTTHTFRHVFWTWLTFSRGVVCHFPFNTLNDFYIRKKKQIHINRRKVRIHQTVFIYLLNHVTIFVNLWNWKHHLPPSYNRVHTKFCLCVCSLL